MEYSIGFLENLGDFQGNAKKGFMDLAIIVLATT